MMMSTLFYVVRDLGNPLYDFSTTQHLYLMQTRRHGTVLMMIKNANGPSAYNTAIPIRVLIPGGPNDQHLMHNLGLAWTAFHQLKLCITGFMGEMGRDT